MFLHDPLGGEPLATTPAIAPDDAAAAPDATTPEPTGPAANPNAAAGKQATPANPKSAPVDPNTKTVTIIDGGTGAKREIQVPANSEGQPAASGDARLIEKSR